MTAGLARRSPLADTPLPDGAHEVPFLTQLNIRADAADGLPAEPNTVRVEDHLAVLWLGPDEWLVVGPADATGRTESAVRRRVGGALRAVVDVSANRTTIELAGTRAREILASGCSLDLDEPAFGPGRCAQTMVARAQVILWQVDDAPTYRLLVRPSFASYLAAWLADAAAGLDAG
jgi:sarcosine oxidase, subunit gamma